MPNSKKTWTWMTLNYVQVDEDTEAKEGEWDNPDEKH